MGMVKKLCLRCRVTCLCQAQQRRCHAPERNKFGKTGYACYGSLVSVVTKKTKTVAKKTPRAASAPVVLDEARERSDYIEVVRGQALKNAHRARERAKQHEADRKKVVSHLARIDRMIEKWKQIEQASLRRSVASDTAILAIRERARRAAQISAVRRRLVKAARSQEDV